MNLNRRAREFYTLQITTSPAVTGWEASFDGGTTWVAGTDATLDGNPVVRWLLAGPDATVGSAVATITGTVNPQVRATASPEVVIRKAPAVVLT